MNETDILWSNYTAVRIYFQSGWNSVYVTLIP